MKKIQIMTDTTCDLPKTLCQHYGIEMLPLYVVLDGESMRDGEDITPDELFKWSETTRKAPKTAAPSHADAVAFLQPHVEAGEDIVFIGIAESMSATCQVVRLAAQDLPNAHIHVVNGNNLCNGTALLVLQAAQAAQQGATVEEILQLLQRNILKIRTSFVLDTVQYLYRGGRCSAISALAASALRIRPMIVMEQGGMHPGEKFRGTMDKVYGKYLDYLLPQLHNADKQCAFVATTVGVSPDIAQQISEQVQSLGFQQVIQAQAGCVISSHCGPGTLGVFFMEGS